ncbi:MAG TPA: aldose 1-epimerase family protein [Erysipelotrichaceae bacterium]|nr:aldose 1-epimerase family protein [Erysipelotrichaceae bacterium]HQA85593.1 aldose 1-epimerase family protein [Erysipelotrichaceae bacterium]
MKIKNDFIQLEVIEKGGEIQSLLFDGKEVMWQGDPNHWKGKNPTLFPIVGNTYSKSYQIDGKTYSMNNHGFIRDNNLVCIKCNDNEIIMELKENEDTLSRYPFQFTYQIKYFLDKNKVNIDYRIRNDSEKEMPFTFGLHPGFNVLNFEDSYLKYEKKEVVKQIVFNDGSLYEKDVMLDKWQLSYEDVKKYQTIIYKGLESKYVKLVLKDYTVKMGIEGFPYFAIWTSDDEAMFICLEPWYGHGDLEKVEADFKDREGMMSLKPKEVFETGYSIELIK